MVWTDKMLSTALLVWPVAQEEPALKEPRDFRVPQAALPLLAMRALMAMPETTDKLVLLVKMASLPSVVLRVCPLQRVRMALLVRLVRWALLALPVDPMARMALVPWL